MAEHCADYPVTVMCHVLEVSVSGYYAWHKREPSQHSREDATLVVQALQMAIARRCPEAELTSSLGSR